MARTVFVTTQGDTFIKTIELKNQLGAALDITNALIQMTVKTNINDPDSARIFQKNTSNGGIFIADGVNGRFEIRINPPDTKAIEGDFFFDVQVIIADNVNTVLNGILTVTPEVTVSVVDL